MVQLDDGRLVDIYPTAGMDIVTPVEELSPPRLETDLTTGIAENGEQWARPFPAASPLELVARWETTDHVPRALALYDALGQLHVSPDPVQQIAHLWLDEPQSAIIVQTWEQAAAVREAIRRARPAADAPDPSVLLAEPAYRTRVDAEKSGEPGLSLDSAYVLADLDDRAMLTRALSIAERSHLVIRPPDQLIADLQAIHAREIADALEAANAVNSPPGSGADSVDAVPTRTVELAIETSLRHAEAQRLIERHADLQRGDD
jgi:hypothetical protein